MKKLSLKELEVTSFTTVDTESVKAGGAFDTQRKSYCVCDTDEVDRNGLALC